MHAPAAHYEDAGTATRHSVCELEEQRGLAAAFWPAQQAVGETGAERREALQLRGCRRREKVGQAQAGTSLITSCSSPSSLRGHLGKGRSHISQLLPCWCSDQDHFSGSHDWAAICTAIAPGAFPGTMQSATSLK